MRFLIFFSFDFFRRWWFFFTLFLSAYHFITSLRYFIRSQYFFSIATFRFSILSGCLFQLSHWILSNCSGVGGTSFADLITESLGTNLLESRSRVKRIFPIIFLRVSAIKWITWFHDEWNNFRAPLGHSLAANIIFFPPPAWFACKIEKKCLGRRLEGWCLSSGDYYVQPGTQFQTPKGVNIWRESVSGSLLSFSL